MGIQKFGQGDVLADEDVQKTAAVESEQDRMEREAALAEENDEADR